MGARPFDSSQGQKDWAMNNALKNIMVLLLGLMTAALTGCSSVAGGSELPQAPTVSAREGPGEDYLIGPLDQLTVFVWRNPELGAKVQVRPDGRVTTGTALPSTQPLFSVAI